MKLNIAIAGATGNVGRKIIEVLEKRNFPVDNLYLLASKNSEGKKAVSYTHLTLPTTPYV